MNFFVSLHDVFSKTGTKTAFEITLRKANLDKNSISFIEPSIWNKVGSELKFLKTTTLFIHI